MLESAIPRLLGWIPPSLRSAIIGSPERPGRVATLAHNLINRLRPPESQVLTCRGPLEGYRMCIDWTQYRSFVYGNWEPSVIRAVTETIKKGMLVIDVGAHIGYYALYFAKCVGPTGQVFCFEPVPENLSLLRKNVHLNGLSWVQIFADAVYSSAGNVSIAVPDESANSGKGSVVHSQGNRQFLVPAVTLDSFCSSHTLEPDFVKLDVEGAEFEVLCGARNTIAKCRPTLLIELHHFDGNVAGHPVPVWLEGCGYQVRWIEQWRLTSHILATPMGIRSKDPIRGL